MTLSNKLHNKMLYEKSIKRKTRDAILTQKWGERYTRYRQEWDKDIFSEDNIPKFPLECSFQLVDSCNLKCAICHSRKRTGERLGGG